MAAMKANEISGEIVDAAIKVHMTLGPGLLESVYEACLAYELSQKGFRVERQLLLPVRYGETTVDAGLRLDLLVEDMVIVELKAVETLLPIHSAQLLTYLKLGNYPLGLLLNFNVVRLKDGIKRLVNGMKE